MNAGQGRKRNAPRCQGRQGSVQSSGPTPAIRLILNGIWKSKMETHVNEVSGPAQPREPKPSEPIGPGGTPNCGQAKPGEAFLLGLPVLAALVCIQGFPHRLGSLWFI